MRSPEAVFDVSAYQDAPPHDDFAFALEGAKAKSAAIVAAAKAERRLMIKIYVPSR
jgi:hypothetical protein